MVDKRHCERCFTSVRPNQHTQWGWLCNGCKVAVQQIIDFLEVRGFQYLELSPESDESISTDVETREE